MAKPTRPEVRARLVVTLIVAVGMVIFAVASWRLASYWQSRPTARLSPKPMTLQAGANQAVVQTDCYGFMLPDEFATSYSADCTENTYARSRKYQYINVAPYYGVTSDEAMLARWRERWLTLGGTERDLTRLSLAGKSAWRVVDYYPQNQESFVTYLVRLPRPVRINGDQPVSALEIRGWGTSDADRQLLDAMISSWQWRI